MSQLFPTCAEAARRLSEQQDVPLNGPTRLGLRLHLALCTHCRRYSRQLQLLRSLVRDYPERLSKARLPDPARAEIIHKLNGLS